MTEAQNPFDPAGAAAAVPAAAAPAPAAPPGGFDPNAAATGVAEEIDVDFSGTSDDFVPLDDGWYKFVIESATARDDSNGGPLLSQKGAQMIRWIARVVEGPRANTPMYLYTVISGPGAFSLRKFLNKAFALNLGKTPMRLQLGPFIGKYFYGQVGKQANNADYTEFKDYRPENSPPPANGAAPASVGGAALPAGIGGKI